MCVFFIVKKQQQQKQRMFMQVIKKLLVYLIKEIFQCIFLCYRFYFVHVCNQCVLVCL